VSGYAAGSTPNPCILCNQRIKFQALEDRGLASGFDAMATGHYARILRSEAEDGVELHRACSLAKDQSYVLAALGIERLARAHFPLGDVRSKSEVRQEARRRGLPVHDRPDSFDACFVADGDLPGFLGRLLGERPGEILDEDGAVVGEHRGAYSFTVGQRKGLRLARPALDGEPRYVLKVDPATNVVVVGPRASLKARSLTGTGVVWLAPDIPVREPTSCLVQVRAHGVAVSAKVAVEGDLLRVTLDEPMIRVAAGQTIVVYDGTRVLGQATAAEAA
jgi:tRNA-specific 2-thiouridylase